MDEMLTVIDDEHGTFRIEFCYGKAFVHSTIRKPLAAMRVSKMVLAHAKRILLNMGYQKMHVLVNETNVLLCKFAMSMGFRETHRGGGYVIMEQENGR